MDYIIIGGGIIGSSIARAISAKNLGKVIVLEKEKTLGKHASGRNSGVLHSGINQRPGSMKAKMCLDGNKRARQYCKEHKVKMEKCGSLVVALREKDKIGLKELKQMGQKAGVLDLKIISKKELNEKEPDVEGISALFSPNGAIVDSLGFLNSVAKDARHDGAEYEFGCEVLDIKENKVITSKGNFKGHIINCAGLYADKIAHMMGIGLDFRIVPFRGEYMEIKNHRMNSMVYQVPDLRFPFLGVHLTKMIDKKVLVGPSSVLSFGRQSYKKEFDFKETLDMVSSMNFLRLVSSKVFLKMTYSNMKMSLSKSSYLDELRKLYKDAQQKDIRPSISGIRAQMVDKKGNMVNDLVVEQTKNSTHILNAVSPG